jgi:hypothetical protein
VVEVEEKAEMDNDELESVDYILEDENKNKTQTPYIHFDGRKFNVD